MLQRRGGDAWLVLSGAIDMRAVETYAERLREGFVEHNPGDDLWIDLSSVDFMDSSGLSILFRARNVARAVHLIQTPAMVETLLARTGTAGMFERA